MKKCRIRLFAAVAAASCIVAFASCSPTYKSVKRMQRMEEGVGNPTTKEELEAAIKKYEKRAMDLTLSEEQTGIWYKILATRYLDLQMYGKAMGYFQKSLEYFPDNANLYYYVGLCATYLANSQLDFNGQGATSEYMIKKNNYLKLAENAFIQAVSINPKYYKAMYTLGVLYAFQLNDGAKAIPHLEKFLSTQKKDTDGMFVLARAYAMEGEYEKAIALYDKIISYKSNDENVKTAKDFKKKILDSMTKNR
ncbi:MAG: tetratricopeptide repeat protein [Treponema sp.]|nr:tetratricopeptide repeat protein [Treponema sp.]